MGFLKFNLLVWSFLAAFKLQASISKPLFKKAPKGPTIKIDLKELSQKRRFWQMELSPLDTNRPSILDFSNTRKKDLEKMVYSYDQENWHPLVTQKTWKTMSKRILVEKRFNGKKVSLAMHEPYRVSHLEAYLKKIEKNPFVKVTRIGKTQKGYDFPVVTVANFDYLVSKPIRIFINARSSALDVSSSWAIEGMIDFLAHSFEGQRLAKYFIFTIVPMHAMDDVTRYYAKKPPSPMRLIRGWAYDPQKKGLWQKAPRENHLLAHMLEKFQKGPYNVKMAVTLGSFDDRYPRFVSFFSAENRRLSSLERKLYFKQQKLSMLFHESNGFMGEKAIHFSGTGLQNTMQQSYLWKKYQDDIFSIKFETPQRGLFVTKKHQKALGGKLAASLMHYYLSQSNAP